MGTESNVPITVPSGSKWVIRPVLTHRTRRRLDRVGRTAAFATMAELGESGVDVDTLLAKANTQTSGKELMPEQQDELLLAQTVSIDGENTITDATIDELDEPDFECVLARMRELYGFDEPESDEAVNEGKGHSGDDSSFLAMNQVGDPPPDLTPIGSGTTPSSMSSTSSVAG